MVQSTKQPGMPFDFSQFGNLDTGAWESMSEASRKMLEASATMNKEIFDFVSTRLKEDMEAQQKLLNAKSFEELQSTYAEFFQNASRHYVEEMQKLFGMATSSMTEAAQTATKKGKK